MSKKLGLILIVFLSMLQDISAFADVSSPSLGYSHLGTQNTEYLLQQTEYSYDGNTTVETVSGVSYRKLSGGPSSLYMYFKVDDTLIYDGNAKDVFISIKYLDQGNQSFAIQYDGYNSVYESSADWVTLTNTEKIKTFTFLTENPKFSNRQTLGSDFRIVIPGNQRSLYIHSVVVQKAPGKCYPPSYTNFTHPTYSSTDKLIIANPYFFWYKYGDGTFAGCSTGCGNGDSENFYIYDGSDFLGDHMAGYNEPYQAGTKNEHPGFDYSYENKSTHKQELKDMMRADIDGLSADYWGGMNLYNSSGYYSGEDDGIGLANNVYFPYSNLINYRADVDGKNMSMIGLDALSDAELEMIDQDKLKPPHIALFLYTAT